MHEHTEDHKCKRKNCTCACHRETTGGGAEVEKPVKCTNQKCGCNKK